MGSPVSAVIAKMVMKEVEKRASATSSVKPFFCKRYVNDVIFAVPGIEAERLLSHLNSVEPSVQFTLEREKDRHLPFLDWKVSRGVQGNLETSVFRKPTHTDKYLAFDSHHPISHKKSVAKTLLRGADCQPSSLDSKAEERKCVSNVLKANGYTKTFLRNCQKPVTTSSTLGEREAATGFAVIPYTQGVTEPIKRIRILSRKNNEPTPFILFLALTVTMNTSDRPNVSLVHVWKNIKDRFYFAKRRI